MKEQEDGGFVKPERSYATISPKEVDVVPVVRCSLCGVLLVAGINGRGCLHLQGLTRDRYKIDMVVEPCSCMNDRLKRHVLEMIPEIIEATGKALVGQRRS